MTFNSFIYGFPFVWVCLSAFFLGAAFSRITRSVKKNRDREKMKTRKWICVCIYFSLSIICAMGAFLIPVSREIADIKYLYLFFIIAGFSFLGLRFKKAFGLPFFFIFIFSFILLLLFFQSITAFTGETEIAQVTILSVKDNFMTIELSLPDNRTELLEMKGNAFAPVVKVVIFDDLLVFSGIKTWYRFAGIVSFENESEREILPPADIYEFKDEPEISRSLYRFVEKNEKYIPGIKSVQKETIEKQAQEFTRYSIRVQHDGGVIVGIVK